MIERTQTRMALKPKRLVADTAYGRGKFLGWLIGTGIKPLWDMSQREDGTFAGADFKFDEEGNVYVCPTRKLQATTGSVAPAMFCARSSESRDCEACPFKPQCCPKTPSRKVPRGLNENACDYVRALMGNTRS
jgi:hypothetical protein